MSIRRDRHKKRRQELLDRWFIKGKRAGETD